MNRAAEFKTMKRFTAAAILLVAFGSPLPTKAADAERAAPSAVLPAPVPATALPVTAAPDAADATALEPVVSAEQQAERQEQQGPRWGVRLGRGALYEKTNSTKADVTRLSFLIGADIEWALASSRVGVSLEYDRFSAADGNQTIQVSNLNETLFTWVDFAFAREGRFIPYAGVGFGASRVTAETQLSGQSERATGLWLPAAGARIGVLAAWRPMLRLRTDARYETGQDLKTNDARMGVVVSLQYLFSPATLR